MSLLLRQNQTEDAITVHNPRHSQGVVGQLASRFWHIVSLWQQPNPPPQRQLPYQQPPPYGQHPPPPGQQTPWGPPPRGYGEPPMPYQSGGGFQGRQVIGGLLMAFGAISIVMFFVAPWLSYSSDQILDALRDYVSRSDYANKNGWRADDIDPKEFDGIDNCRYTGWQIASRDNGNRKCSDIDNIEANVEEHFDIGYLPLVERSVHVMPVLGLLISLFGLILMLKREPSSLIFGLGLIVALGLVVFPFSWSLVHKAEYEDFAIYIVAGTTTVTPDGEETVELVITDEDLVDFQSGWFVAIISSSYQTILQTIVPLLTLITVITGFFVVGGDKPPQYPPPFPGQPMNPYQQQPPPPRY